MGRACKRAFRQLRQSGHMLEALGFLLLYIQTKLRLSYKH
jgi:hypothetical protein